MTYEVETKDGIVIRGIPDDVPPDDPRIKEKVAAARRQSVAATIDADQISQGARESARPTIGEDLAKQSLLTARYGLEGLGGGIIADKIGLPTPQGSSERVVGDVARTMAGGAGVGAMAQQASKMLTGIPKLVAEMLAANQGAQAVSSAAAGAGGGLARESGAGELGQTGAALAAGMSVPVAGALASKAGGKIADAAATVGASYGNKRAIERIAGQAAREIAGDSLPLQQHILTNATEYVPGAKPTVAEALAEANMRSDGRVGGKTMRLQKDLSGGPGIEDVLPSNAASQKAALEAYAQTVKDTTAPMREAALRGANLGGGVPTEYILRGIDVQLTKPGFRSSDVVKKSLTAVKEKIAGLTEGGLIDAEDLYTVRKEIGNTIQQYAKETANWDKRLSAGLEKTLQASIDDTIEHWGGRGWKEYIKTYSSGMKNIEKTLERQKAAKRMAAEVKSSNAQDIAKGDLPTIPNLLSRPVAYTNFALRLIARDANTPVTKRLAEAMTNPEEYARLLKLPESHPIGQRAREIAQQAAVATMLYEQQKQ